MSAKLKLQPFSAPIAETKAIAFVVSGLVPSKTYRIGFENATFGRVLKPNTLSSGSVVGDKIIVGSVSEVTGRVDLALSEADAASVISVYANVEEKSESGAWRLSDIAAFAFQVQSSKVKSTGDRISVYPPFIGLQEKATIKVHTQPNSSLHVIVNDKKFIVKSNYSGEGSISFRAIDVLTGSSASSGTLQKFPIRYSRSADKHAETYDSGSFIHFVPEEMKALQATNDPEAPECAILDPIPGQGLKLEKLDDFCVDGAVVGSMSIFDDESAFYNSKIGFCSELKEVYPIDNDSVCRIYNSTSSTSLSNGSGLVVFSSQETFESDENAFPTLSSRVFIANLLSSLKYNGNPVRDGSILKPPKFYHTAIPSGVAVDQKYGITFRVDDGTVFEIQYTTILGTLSELITSFVELINNDLRCRLYSIKAVDQGDFIEIKSDTRFTIRSDVYAGNGTLEVQLKSNKTLELLVDSSAIKDSGNTVVFLTPKVGYQFHEISSRDMVNNLIRIEVPDGFNNDIGPNIYESIYCQKFVIVDSTKELQENDLIEVNPLPYVYDIFNREVSCAYPVIASRKIEDTGEEIAYVVCQAPVDGIYQLFYYSFRVGQSVENNQWKQLTQLGENKNAKIKCDSVGNLHIVWESDRIGPTQLYYSVLGPSAKPINNQILMSILDKNVLSGANVDLYSITEPTVKLQSPFSRMIANDGKVSVYDRSYVAIEGDCSKDTAMAYYSLSKDEFGNDFPANFAQLSYQVSFDLWMPYLSTGVLTDKEIAAKFAEWKSEFSPAGNYKYAKNKNIYTIDSYEAFYENFIPVCGAFKLDGSSIEINSGGAVVDDVPHRQSLVYTSYDESMSLANPANVKHWMLAIIPEKIRFKAKNTETFAQFCERNELELSDCEGFANEIEYELNTGRYKLALLLATCENESTGQVAKKTYLIKRLLDGYVDFSSAEKVKISVHYAKAGSDHINGVMNRDREAFANEYRYYGDIVVSLNNKIICASSFLADFSDQIRKFDIALGIPPGSGFSINESTPYKGNMYESRNIKQIFANLSISPHTLVLDPSYIDFSEFERDVAQMVVPDVVKNILSNGSFEETVMPYQNLLPLYDGYESVTGWTVGYGALYRRTPTVIPNTEIGFSASDRTSWMELTGLSSPTVQKGFITNSFATTIGKKYWVFFDLANQPESYVQGSSVTKKVKVTLGTTSKTFSTTINATGPSAMNWKTVSMSFVATSTTTTIKLENASNQFNDGRDVQYGPQIDAIIAIAEEDLNDELDSFTTAESLLVDQPEFDLNYSLNVTSNFTQIPITLSNDYQNKSADLFVDKIDKIHVAWQSNRDGYWNVYYGGSRLRNNPFRFDTKISDSKSNSVNPSVCVDGVGRRLIAWQDARNGKYQIYAAMSKVADQMLVDRCKQDEVDEFLYKWNSSIDPYYDTDVLPISQLNCAVEFTFLAPETSLFHFNISFYEDKDYSVLYKRISSKESINGWRVDNKQISYNGLSAIDETQYLVSYTPSNEDDITGRVLYAVVEYEINSNIIDVVASQNVAILRPYSGLSLKTGRLEKSNEVRALLEFEDESPTEVAAQNLASLNTGGYSGVSFAGSLTELPGVEIGQKIRSILLHFDPEGSEGSVTAKVKFTSPILALFISGSKLGSTNSVFGHPGVTYPGGGGAGVENNDTITVSADRKTLDLFLYTNPVIDQIRVILLDNTSVVGENQFVYYCPSKQSSRCDVSCSFSNNSDVAEDIHFRVSFYADPEKTNLVMSSFTKTDTLNWFSSSSSFPSNGVSVEPGQSISVIYSPEILPFEFYESQTKTTLTPSSVVRQPLLCGIPYRVVIESYRNGSFFVESEYELLCPCEKTASDFWKTDYDSQNWLSSGQGFEDFRISLADGNCLFPKVSVTENDIFYVMWQDFRYTRLLDSQSPSSPDYFMALYDTENDNFQCSGQGGYDRRLTYFSETEKYLYDASVFIDPFQNINLTLHDGKKVYNQSCSLGCKFTAKNKDLILPCMFTDETDPSFFVVGGSPDRTVDQYQKVRISPESVAYSTYLDVNTPIPVVTDCFVELDIIGVPGTYAFRLRNETDEDWSEWIPIGPDLPEQTQKDTTATPAERDFFRAYFVERNRFVAPWVASSGNGVKRICCEVLTFFGKTESFCVDFMALYDSIEYKIDLFFDEDFSQPVPKFKNYPVVSKSKTESVIDDSNLSSISDDITEVSTIYARIEFRDKQKIALLERLKSVERLGLSSNILMNVYQQGINDQTGIVVEKIRDGVYRGSFSVFVDDGIINIDGIGIITLDIPGQCGSSDSTTRSISLTTSGTLDQSVSIFNNFTLFREKYTTSDVKGSFGNPDYYKIRKFGIGGSSDWFGGGPGPVNNNIGYEGSGSPDGGGSGGSGGNGGGGSGGNGEGSG